MKKILIPLIMVAVFSSCGNSDQNKAVSDAKEVQAAIEQMQPGTIPTSKDGWSMNAKINGKTWVATSIMSPEAAGRIIGYYKDEYIGLPYDRRDMVVGHKSKFGEHNAVDIFTNDDIGLWGGRKGEMEITKVDDSWAEGKFFVTGSSINNDKTIEITDGFFRISMKNNQ